MARENLVSVDMPGRGPIDMLTTPIKLPGQTFETAAPPSVGEHTRSLLRDLLDYDADRLSALAEAGVIQADA